MKKLNLNQIQLYKETSNKLTGSNRRNFQAKITKAYLGGRPWKAERVFGWCRKAVALVPYSRSLEQEDKNFKGYFSPEKVVQSTRG